MSPEAALDAVRRHLAAMAVPDGAAFLATHAPDALVLHRGAAARVADVDPADFAAAHAEAVAAQAAAGPGFPAAAALTLAALTPLDGDRAIALVDAADPALDAPLRLAVGLQGDRVAWATLDPAADPLTWGVGRALAAAEFPFVTAHAPYPHRGWLDVAYRRLHHPPRPALAFLPEARFACGGTGRCCKMTWEVTVPASAQAFVDALPMDEIAPELVGTQLEPKGDGQLYLKRRDESCRFLDGNGWCRIHARLGTPVFTPCVTFPMRFTGTPDGVAVTTSRACGSASAELGPTLESRSDEVWRRYAQAGPMFTFKPRLTRARDVGWPEYQAAEADVLDALRLQGLPLLRRLWIAGRLLTARLEGREADREALIDAAGLELLPPLTEREASFVRTYLPYPIGITAMLDEGLTPANAMRWAGTRVRDEARVARWFENVVFAKDLPTEFGLVATHALLVVFYLFVLSLEHALDGPIPEDLWTMLGTGVDHRILALGGWKQLFELVPAIAESFDHPDAALVLLRHAHHAAS